MATLSSILAWRIPWTELQSMTRLQSMGSQRVGYDPVTRQVAFHCLAVLGFILLCLIYVMSPPKLTYLV